MTRSAIPGSGGVHDDDPPGEPHDRVRLPIVVCKYLRTKNAFGTREAAAPDWREGASTTAVDRCLRTMETWGTDDAVAHPRPCREGRVCFAPPFDPVV